MTQKPIILRGPANLDIEDVVDYFTDAAGEAVVQAFIAALEHAYALLTRHPAIGAPRYAVQLGLPGLRCINLRRFPYLLFYIEQDTHIVILRVLHTQRDIPAHMQEPQSA